MYKPDIMKVLMLLIACFTIAFTRAQPVKFAIHFAHDVHTLDAENTNRLDSLAAALKQRPALPAITITGHCDSTGSNTYNMALSQRRINTVTALLKNRLGDSLVITAEAKGEYEPVADNGLDEGRMLNRRVEISYELPLKNIPFEEIPVARKEQPLEEAVKKSAVGQNIVLKNMNFYGGTHRLLPASQPILEELLQVLKENPALEIDIQGHICCVPGPEDGLDVETNTIDLSVQRAKSVYQYLVNMGIEAKRLSYRGYGHQFPLTQERTDNEQETNRRVEIRIVKK